DDARVDTEEIAGDERHERAANAQLQAGAAETAAPIVFDVAASTRVLPAHGELRMRPARDSCANRNVTATLRGGSLRTPELEANRRLAQPGARPHAPRPMRES